jgi:metal-dependent amidase/aminoacylase/carboxypeptidase family protein
VKAEAEAAGAEKPPTIERYEFTDAVVNDSGLSEKLRAQEKLALGAANVIQLAPGTGSEDYSFFVTAGVPSVYFDLGAANQKVFDEAKAAGKNLPSLHSSLFAPDVDPALKTGIAAEVTALRSLLR